MIFKILFSRRKSLKLNPSKFEIPEFNNLSGIIYNVNSKYTVARKFKKLNWSIRKSTYHDFELECEWASFQLEGYDHILINGIIDPKMFNHLSSLLKQFGVDYKLELYDGNHILNECSFKK